MSEIPRVRILDAISPANSGTGEEVLVYGGLASAVEKYRPTNSARFTEFLESEAGSLEELSKARQLALEYYLRTADKVVSSHGGGRDLWADRLTQASIELYGEPDKEEATRLLRRECRFLSQLRGREGISQQHVDFLLGVYGSMLVDNAVTVTDESTAEKENAAIYQYGEAIRSKYQPLFDLVDTSGKSEFSASDLQEFFSEALDWLRENDDENWAGWRVVDTDGTSLSVDASNREINIASRRERATAQDARGLIAHELLVHALRSKNGYKAGGEELVTGMAGYLEAEEGLGILAEEAINGELPEKAYDRYVDIALALGSVDGVQRTRAEIFHISFARQLVRGQARGTLSEADISSLERRVRVHVDRIYRGGPGDNLGTRQAIFTKDIAYYVGYRQMAEYIASQLAAGKTAGEVFEYLSQARFDPTNPQHVARLAKILR